MAEAKKSNVKKPAAKKPVAKKAPAKAAKKNTSATKKTSNVASKKSVSSKKQVKKVPEATSKKPVSDSVKKRSSSGSDMWKAVAVVLVLLVVILGGFAVYMWMNQDSNDNSDTMSNSSNDNSIATEGVVKLTVIEDPTCTTCQVDLFAQNVKENLIPDMAVEKVDFQSEDGQKFVDALGMKFAPAFLFSTDIAERDDWATSLASAFIPVNINGVDYYQLNPQIVQSKILIGDVVITDSAIVLGNPDAKVTVVEFTDYECPYCAIAEGNAKLVSQFTAQSPGYVPAIPNVMTDFVDTGKIRYVFYNFPLESLHPQSRSAHLAALCANEQGSWKEYNDVLFGDRDTWISASDRIVQFKQYAKDLRLDEDQFAQCLDSKKYNDQIEEEISLALSYGVTGTPGFFVNRVFLSGAQDYSVFKAVIEQELGE